MLLQPLEQFSVIIVTWYKNTPITNFTIYAFFLFLFFSKILSFPVRHMTLWRPNFYFLAGLDYFKFIYRLVYQQLGKKGTKFFPLLYTLFSFILFSNLLGMTLYGYTLTSNIIVTFTLSFSIFIGVTIYGFIIQGIKFLKIFLPSGAPTLMIPLLLVIEFISYLSRPFSLGIRLFANLMSGHTLMFILGDFTIKIFAYNAFFGLIPYFLITAIVGLELSIGALQAYVFVVLICIYLKDSLYGH